ncbi:hypothetical protein JW851_00345 [Candidatus Woesearchaeota archaeon]|nr:hypothetical protein [Candidatus Woesearchaeota archaeon]
MREKKRSVIVGLLISFIAHFVYIAGLSIMIPLLFFVFFPEHLWTSVVYAKSMIFFAVGLVVISAFVLYIYNNSIGRTFFSLGLATFVPGSLALVFSVYNKEFVFGFIRTYLKQFNLIEPYLDTYLAHSMPRVWALTVSYILIGVIFIWLGIRYSRRETTRSLAKRVFGPRARIIR